MRIQTGCGPRLATRSEARKAMAVIDVRIARETANDSTVQLLEWLVEDGGQVRAHQAVAEVESSKVTIAVVSPGDGYLIRVTEAGDVVPVGGVIAQLCSNAGEAQQLKAASRAQQRVAAATTQFSKAAIEYVREHGVPASAFYGMDLV